MKSKKGLSCGSTILHIVTLSALIFVLMTIAVRTVAGTKISSAEIFKQSEFYKEIVDESQVSLTRLRPESAYKRTDAFAINLSKTRAKNGVSVNSLTQNSVLPPKLLSPGTITTCGEIIQSGVYTLGSSVISPPGQSCINIHDTTNVTLDCANNPITFNTDEFSNFMESSAIKIKNVSGLKIKSCNVKVLQNGINFGAPLNLVNVMNANISSSTFGSQIISFSSTSAVTFTGNNVASTLQAYDSNNLIITNNNFIPESTTTIMAAVLIIQRGNDITISNNYLDGRWNGKGVLGSGGQGADDGIVFGYNTNGVIKNNTIINNWECGIENVGFVQNFSIDGNKMKNNSYCGVGGWHWNSWKDSTVSNNIVDGSVFLFAFFRFWDLLPTESKVVFKNNIFSDNILANQVVRIEDHPTNSSFIDFKFLFGNSLSLPTDVSNNVFKGNDFGFLNIAPWFSPTSGFVDGGFNICQSGDVIDYPKGDFPLKCTDRAKQVFAPTNLVASNVTTNSATLSWSKASSTSSIAGYVVLRSNLPIATSTNLSYTDNSLTSETSYVYSIKAYDQNGYYSDSSQSITLTTSFLNPTLEFINPKDNAAIPLSRSLLVSVTIKNVKNLTGSQQLYIDGKYKAELNPDANGIFKANISTTNLSNGSHTFSVTATDINGRKFSTTSTTFIGDVVKVPIKDPEQPKAPRRFR